MDAAAAASEAKLGLGMAGSMHNCTAHGDGGGFAISEIVTNTLLNVFSVIEGHPYGYLGYIFFLAFWTTIAAPVTPVEIGGGCVFGPFWGSAASLTGKTLGCLIAVIIGRVFGRSWTMPQALEPYLDQIRQRPFLAMSAIRIAPIPLGVKNYGLSLVRFPRDDFPYVMYIVSCFVVGLPFSFMWGNVGAGFKSVAEALKSK